MIKKENITVPEISLEIEEFNKTPLEIKISARNFFGKSYNSKVEIGSVVSQGQVLGESEIEHIHSSIDGRVTYIDNDYFYISSEEIVATNRPENPYDINKDKFSDYLAIIGLVGMGGSRFPASFKFNASKNIDTIIINGAECEPGVSIDKALLVNQSEFILKGINTLLEVSKATKVLIAIKDHPELYKKIKELYPFDIFVLPAKYPVGAEKLILQKILKQKIPFGKFPFEYGFLIHNVTTMRSLGKSLIDKTPVIERPLTLSIPHKNFYKNILVPVGISVSEIFDYFKIEFDSTSEKIIAGGMMMGNIASLDFNVHKGTTSIFVIPSKALKEHTRECINCGACVDACPLDLHPIGMEKRIKRFRKHEDVSLTAHLTECFLCGACEYICPVRIPLVKKIKEGKACLKKK